MKTKLKHLKRILLLGGLLSSLLYPLAYSNSAWSKHPLSQSNLEVSSILVHPLAPQKLIAAQNKRILEAEDPYHWKTLWEGKSFIDQILFFPEKSQSIFILSKDGIYEMNVKNSEVRKIYSDTLSTKETKYGFTLLTNDSEHWFASSSNGIYESDDSGKNWVRMDSLKQKSISNLIFSHERLIAANNHQLFISENLTDFSPALIFIKENTEIASDENLLPDENEEIASSTPNIHEIISGKRNGKYYLWAASSLGVFESQDNGKTWKKLSQSGLTDISLSRMVFSENSGRLFAANSAGVYEFHFDAQKWVRLFEGMKVSRIFDLALVNQKTLIASSNEGLLRYILLPDQIQPAQVKIDLYQNRHAELLDWIQLEPSIHEIRKEAIRYADLGQSKIQRWHLASRLQAFLPNFSFSKDFSRSPSIDLDRGGTSDADKYILGPDDIAQGWDASLSWDLGDFIWSSSQTSIDSRSKINAEYRYELLSEITRIYYERRRLQEEFFLNPPQNFSEHRERLLRIEELSSILDSATNGYFSKMLSEKLKHNLATNSIWDFQETT